MTASTAQPCRWLPTMRPKTLVSAAPSAKIEIICTIVGKGGRIFERMRGIGVEEAAAICAEHLDRDLRGNRPDRDGLLGPFHCRRIHVRAKCLRDALPDQEQRIGHADGDQDVKRHAGDIDPKIADGAHRVPREAADERDRQHDAGCRGKEVLMREAEHLHEVGHRAFAAVVLPVGVGDEAHRRIERQILRRRPTVRPD